jgi:hypothetical protein
MEPNTEPNMERLIPKVVLDAFEHWANRHVYVHLETNPVSYWRNGRILLTTAHVKGQGPYRLFLEFDHKAGLIQVGELTHMKLQQGRIALVGYDKQQRIAQTIEVSETPLVS